LNNRLAAGRLNAPTWYRSAIVIGIAGLTLLAFASCARIDPARRWSIDEIRSEFSKVKGPESARPIEGEHSLKKYGVSSVSRRYSANAADEEILKHYRTALIGGGWQFANSLRRGDQFGESYCKSKLLASVELLNAGPPSAREYEFSISWSEISEKKCP
jgi:hypothetical protein